MDKKYILTDVQHQEIIDAVNQSTPPGTSSWTKDDMVRACVNAFKVGVAMSSTHETKTQEELFDEFRIMVLDKFKQSYLDETKS